jgi:hypothetical protein|tara:strand:- start:9937 stop:10266 length:330 start_codon:yes stop_codon:yes gene_type:complete
MRTLEKSTTHNSVAVIDHAWNNKNNAGVVWTVHDVPEDEDAVGGTAALIILMADGTEIPVDLEDDGTIASNVADTIAFDFPIASAIFRYTPANTNDGTLRSVLTPKPIR